MAAIDIVKAHYESLETKSIRVPEWDNLEIFIKPMTMGEQAKLWKVQVDPDRSQFDLYAETIALKALDEAGKRLFSPADAKGLMNVGDMAVVERVASEMVEAIKVDDLKKPSETT